MKREFLKPGALYFICENCGEMCDARGPKVCDCCGEQYTGHEILTYSEMAGRKQEYIPQAHVIQPLPIQPAHRFYAKPIQNSVDEIPLPRPVRLERPVFAYSVRIYEEGQWIDVKDGKQIVLGDSVVGIGRTSLLSDGRLFDDGLSMDSRFNGISRENAVFIQIDGKLFIQYRSDDGIKKSKIRINGIVLEPGKSMQIGEDDEIRFGPIKQPEKCIDIHIHKLLRTSQVDEDFHKEIHQIRESVIHMQTQMAEMDEKLKSFITTINPDILKWKEDDSEESYGNRLDSILPKEGAEEELAQIRQFFLWDTPEGQRDCSRNYSFMWEDKKLAHFLYSAAFYEKVCSVLFDGTEHEDYYPVCGNIGKAVEHFVRHEMVAMINRYMKPEFDEYMASTNCSTEKFVAQAKYLAFLNGNKDRGARIKKLFTSLGIPAREQESRLNEWKKAIKDIFKIVEFRNKNAHPDSIRRGEYLELKALVLRSNAVWAIHQYYIRMVEKNE